jgi:PPOX class probable F420-dependent enzyme
MPAKIPDSVLDLFQEPALGHVSYLDSKGEIVTFPMWVDYDGEHVLTSSRVGSKKGKAFRERPQTAVSIVSVNNPWHWLSVSGRVIDIKPDENLAFIDRLSRRYMGQDYRDRGYEREIFVIAVDRASIGWA